MYEYKDVVEPAPRDSGENYSRRDSKGSVNRVFGLILGSLAVAGGIFAGNFFIFDKLANPSETDSNPGDQAVADQPVPTQNPPKLNPTHKVIATSVHSTAATTTLTSKPKVKAIKSGLESVSFSNSTSATPNGSWNQVAGNGSNSTQASGYGHGQGGSENESGDHEDSQRESGDH